MSSCHREDQGERPPGVRNALFFPVVFRKAVINLIPPSSLPAPGQGVKEGGRARGGREAEKRKKRMGHSLALPKRDATNKTKEEEKKKSTGWSKLLRSFFYFYFVRFE